MPIGRGKSLVLGPALQPDGARTTAYRALEALMCEECRAEIAVDHVFSRRSRHVRVATGYLSSAPVCATCRPLCVDANADG
jgi:hypothetical protein